MKDQMNERGEGRTLEQELSGMERCPLSSAAKAIANIEGAVMLVIGTEECTYYSMAGLFRRGLGDRCFSVVMDKHDVTFGSADKVATAIEELLTETKPTALFIITTCVPEIIGEDYNAIVQEAEEKHKVKIHLLITNHYSGKDGEYGFELVEKAVGYPLPRKKRKHGHPNMGPMGDMDHKFSGKGPGGRPEGGRPDGGRPEGGRHDGGRHESGHPEGGRHEGGRHEGGRHESGHPEGGRHEGGRHEGGRPRGDMSEEEMKAMMRQKMGGHMSEEEIEAKIKSRMGGGGR